MKAKLEKQMKTLEKFENKAATKDKPEPRARASRAAVNDALRAVRTERLRTILELLAHGYDSKQMAQMLGLAIKTVESYRSFLLTELGARNTAHAVYLAMQSGRLEFHELTSDVGVHRPKKKREGDKPNDAC